MKNYVKPSIELNKFDTEEILAASGVVGNYESLTAQSKSLVDQYNTDNAGNQVDAAKGVAEFQW